MSRSTDIATDVATDIAKGIATRADCEALDAADPLAEFRARFHLPKGVIYLDGNSLGPMPLGAAERIGATVRQEWAEDLIESWNGAGWFQMPTALGDRVGALIGAGPGQCVVCDTTSINIYKALHAALAMRPERQVIVAEAGSFPTDLYIAEGTMAASGRPLTRRLLGVDGDRIEDLVDEEVAAVLLSNVDYRTGALHDMAAITAAVHRSGALAIWDLCHSAGVIPMQVDAWEVDFAVGCTYKYLNGGPGAPAYIYAAQRHHAAARQPLSGWWGHADPFAFERDYRPDGGIKRFLCGTQPVVSMRGVECGLDALEGADVGALRRKSQQLTGLFIDQVERIAGEFGLEVVTPRDRQARGSQVAVRFGGGYAVVQALIERGVIGDFRAPDIMRFGFAPLYLRFTDVWDAAEALRETLASGAWREERFSRRAAVT